MVVVGVVMVRNHIHIYTTPYVHHPTCTPSLSTTTTTTDTGADEHDDVTKQIDLHAPLVAYWEHAGAMGDPLEGLCTASQVFQHFSDQGFHITYRRLPLSRERTPEAADLEGLWAQAHAAPNPEHCVHVVLARTATGSSCRFAAAFFALTMMPETPRTMSVNPGLPPPGPSGFGEDPAPLDSRRALQGEYRAVMNLCRVLPNGLEGKAAVDAAVDLCAAIGNVREDVYKCKVIVEGHAGGAGNQGGNGEQPPRHLLEVSAARQHGLHYLQRYFFLIAFKYVVILFQGGMTT